VVGKQYLVRQAALLLKLAKSTSDPQVIAGLVEKAADLKSQVDDAADLSLQAPDVESPTYAVGASVAALFDKNSPQINWGQFT
jgi:hypothetical protein